MSSKATPEVKPAPPAAAWTFTPARAPLLQRKCACGGSEGPGGGCQACNEEKPLLQRRSAGPAVGQGPPPVVQNVLRAPGRPLDPGTRRFMESRLGRDLGQVRVHTDADAARSAQAVNAHAYTVGQDIVFASGQYAPETESGRNLLAHELAHTIQQKGLQRSSAGVSMGGDAEYQRMEREADSVAASVARGGPAGAVRPATRPTLSRAPAVTDTQQAELQANGFEEMEAPPAGVTGIRRFKVNEVFPLPVKKGPSAEEIWQKRAREGGLEAVMDVNNDPRSVLKQLRPAPEVLRSFWLSKVGWSEKDAGQNWKDAGGDSASFTPPRAGKATCEMDHVIELQVGGTNIKENIQVLDKSENASSGSTIRGYLGRKADAVRKVVPELKLKELVLHWEDAKFEGTGVCDVCCAIEQKVIAGLKGKKDKDAPSSEGDKVVDRVPIKAGGSSTEILVASTLADKKKAVPLKDSDLAENKSASTIIPGLVLNELHRNVAPKTISAEIDTSEKTRIPGMTLAKEGRGKGLTISVGKDGLLKIPEKTPAIAFTYPYLSPGQITHVGIDDSGQASWSGTITPKVPLLGPIGVSYANGALTVTKGLDEESLKKKSVLGMRLTKAQVALQLAPEFKPSGEIEMQMGSPTAPLATASLKLSADAVGLVAAGKLSVNIPKMQTAQADITYKGGGGRDEWLTEVHIKSEDIKIGPSVSVTGQFDGKIEKGDISFTGKINVTLPGDNKAELGLKKDKSDWLLFGGGTFNVPKLDPVTVNIQYLLGKDELVATGKTGFTLESLGLKGRLDEVRVVLGKGLSFADAKVSGKGGLDFKKGKAEGHVDVTLHTNGKFSGKGSLSYKIKENIIVTGTVELNEQQKLRVTGELLVTRYELFKQYGDKKDLFSLDLPIPIPGLSIGTSGLVFHIRAGIGVAYSFGPGTLEPLKFSAGFDPLEADPDLELTVTATVKVPASATLSANVSGSLAVQVDILVGSAGAEGGLKLQGDLILSAGAFANLDASYKKKHLTAKLVAGIDTKLLLGLSLTAFARAWAGAFGFSGEMRKDWTLAKKTIDTGIGFYLSAPFEYSDETGVKLPELKDITLKKPELDFGKILGQIFGGASAKEEKK